MATITTNDGTEVIVGPRFMRIGAEDAEAAQAAAEAAQTAAEAAQTGAETAETNAGTSATNAASSATAASTSATNAASSATAAASSATSAATAQTAAETAQTAAEAAQTAAEAAETNAVAAASTITTDYANSGGTGDRTASISVTVSSSLLASGTASNLVDGATGNNTTDSIIFSAVAVAGETIVFDFGAGVAKIITEATWKQGATSTHGTWKWQTSNDGDTWTDAGAAFTLGGATSQTQTVLNGTNYGYRFYRLLGVSGTASGAPWIQEVEFKIAAAPTDGLARFADISRYHAAFPTSKLKAAYFFDEVNSEIVTNEVGGENIDLSAPASQSYERTAHGVRLTGGVIHTPVFDATAAQTILFRAPPTNGLGSGFVIEGPNGNGFLSNTPDASATAEYVAVCGQSFRSVRATREWGLDRGTWGLYHRERATSSTALAVGGRVSVTSSRVTEMEVACLLIWSSAPTADERTEVELWARDYMLSKGVPIHFKDVRKKADLYIGIGDSMCEGVDTVSNIDAADVVVPTTDTYIIAEEAGNADDLKWMIYNHYGSGHAENDVRTVATVKTSPAFGVAYQRAFKSRGFGPAFVLNLGEGSSYVTPSTEATTSSASSWHPTEAKTSAANYHTSLRTIEAAIGYMVEMGYAPSDTLYFFWSFGLNAAVNTSRAPSAAAYQGWLQDLLDQLEADLSAFSIEILMMRAHQDDPASDATALSNVRTGTDDFIAANANVTLLDNDGNAYIGDGVHNTAAVMKTQGIAWHDTRN